MIQRATLPELELSDDEAERAALIDFSVDPAADLPIGVQLTWRIRGMIARGALREGDRLPSVRELARFSTVNVNTARAVYQDLEKAGVIHSEHGRGTFVSGIGGPTVDALVRRAMNEAAEEGIDPMTLVEAFWAAASASSSLRVADAAVETAPEVDAKTRRRELRHEIAAAEKEIAGYAAHDRREAPVQRVPSAGPTARMTSVEDLERVRDGLVERLTRLRGEAEVRGVREQRAKGHVEDMVRDPRAHRGEVATVAGDGPSGPSTWRVVPRYGPVGAILGWWRVEVRS